MKLKLQHGLFVIVACAVLLGFAAGSALAAEYVSVVKDGVNMRSGPDTKYEVLYELPAGYPLKVLGRKGKWLKVVDFEGSKGWIYSSLVDKTPHVIVTVKTEANVRSGPGTKYKKIGSVAREVILKKVDQKGDWVKVSHPQLTGWIHKKLIWP
ncbi:hypothetical protein GF1_10630 [Desulfolithobacter dissulfuricans]|uniref:SH3b domain-containing protein n=1 Tax=Desulfolithobacter dissulfuricans TaxID=2795293 RepID=A0A915U1C0_9BACT|nr:SH3 domain-containing protein [Desulfolithobacter dissulfuricans]BCO08687.1 hypothetical protein GF1_10630 [Desulfolithobacter dissulfuricans]